MGLDRRSFLQFVIGGAVGTMATPIPWKLTDDVSIWTQNWPWIPRLEYGRPGQVKTTVKLGGPEYGVTVNTVQGRPVTVQGDKGHPLSQGGIDPLAAGSAQLLYSPARIKGPMHKTDSGSWALLDWEEAQKLLVDRLESAQGKVAAISGDSTGTTNEILAGLLQGLGSEDFYLMPGDELCSQRTWTESMNGSGRIGFDLEYSDFVLCLGSDLMTNWGSVVQNQEVLGRDTAFFIYCGPLQSRTAAVANSWIPVASQDLGHLALGLAYHLIQAGARFDGAGFKEFKGLVETSYTPAQSEAKCGVGRKALALLAEKMLEAKRPLVIPGAVSGEGAGSFELMAGLSLNLLLGNLNKKGGLQAFPEAPQVVAQAPDMPSLRRRDLVTKVQEIAAGKGQTPEVLLVYEANPAYGLPQAKTMLKGLKNIPFVVAFSPFMDETVAQAADLVLPSPIYLERLDDSYSPFGARGPMYSLCSPVVQPQVDAKPTGDVLIAAAKALDIDLGVASYEAAIKAKAKALGANWRELSRGLVWQGEKRSQQRGLSLGHDLLQAAAKTKTGDSGQYPLALAVQDDLRSGTPSTATAPLTLKTLRADELDAQGMYVCLNSETARRHQVKAGDKIEIRGPHGSIRAQVKVYEGVMPETIAVPQGLGHSAWDEFNKDKGDNVFKVFTVRREPITGLAKWNDSRVAIAKV